MKILEPGQHQGLDEDAARDRKVTVAWRPAGGEAESLLSDYDGPPAHIFWSSAHGIDTPFAVPYGTLWERRDTVARAFGLAGPRRYFSATTLPYSNVRRVVEEMGGAALSLPIGGGGFELIRSIEEFQPEIMQAPIGVFLKLARMKLAIPSLTRIMVVGGCYPIPEGALEATAQTFGVPVVSFLHLPWIGLVAHSDGVTFGPGYVGRLVDKVWIKFSEDGHLDIASGLSEDVRLREDGKWKRMGKDYFRTALKGSIQDGHLTITEGPHDAGVPQRLPR